MTEIPLGRRADLDGETRLLVRVGGREVGVLEHNGELFAYENRCLHQGGPVCEGKIMSRVEAIVGPDRAVRGERFVPEAQRLICPWHGWEYELRTGECVADRSRRLRRYDVVDRDGELFLVVPDD